MDNMKKSKFFLLIGLKQIKFTALNENKNILVEKNVLVNDLSLYENFKSIEGFLNQNIFNFEKKLNNHIKEIDLLLNYDEFLTVDISTINNF